MSSLFCQVSYTIPKGSHRALSAGALPPCASSSHRRSPVPGAGLEGDDVLPAIRSMPSHGVSASRGTGEAHSLFRSCGERIRLSRRFRSTRRIRRGEVRAAWRQTGDGSRPKAGSHRPGTTGAGPDCAPQGRSSEPKDQNPAFSSSQRLASTSGSFIVCWNWAVARNSSTRLV